MPACNAGTHTPAATLLAMGIPADVALGAIRLSTGRTTTVADVRAGAEALVSAVG